MRGCRRELAAVYAEARNGRGLDWQEAARAASVLQILTKMLEGDDFERRIELLEAALAADDRRPPSRANGHPLASSTMTLPSDLSSRLGQLEAAALRRCGAPREHLPEVEILRLWAELSRDPSPPAPLAPDVARMTPAEAVDRWRRLCR